MEKTIEIKMKNAFFLLNIMGSTIKAATEEDLIKKIGFFNAMKDVKAKMKELGEVPAEEMKEFDIESLGEVTLTFTGELLDWVKAKWATVPAEYKLTNMQTGEVVQQGLVSEEECRSAYDVKMALEDARLVK